MALFPSRLPAAWTGGIHDENLRYLTELFVRRDPPSHEARYRSSQPLGRRTGIASANDSVEFWSVLEVVVGSADSNGSIVFSDDLFCAFDLHWNDVFDSDNVSGPTEGQCDA
jgi:hypothetical protein